MARSALFRFDASAHIGGGHAMRCGTLAAALAARGWNCRMAVRPETLPFLHDMNPADAIILDGPVADEVADMAANVREKADLFVIDHYTRDRAYERDCRRLASRILAIDDLGRAPHDCDYLLNQNPGADVAGYADLVPAGCVLMLDPAFAPLRPAFAKQRRARTPTADGEYNILLSFGATDPLRLAPRLARALADRLPSATFHVVAGRDGEADIHAHPRIRVYGFVSDMAGLMARCDFAVGAGGISALERCALGLPSAIVLVADNQRPGSQALEQSGAATILGDAATLDLAQAADAVASMALDPVHLAHMRAAALAVCDGAGAQRVAEIIDANGYRLQVIQALAAESARTTMRAMELHLRLAGPGDIDTLYEWQADPGTRRFARVKTAPTRAEHGAWARRYFADPDRALLIVEQDGLAVGSLRLDWKHDEAKCEISIVVAPHCRGRGMGARMLALLRRVAPGGRLFGYVEDANASSQKAFRSAGFTQIAANVFETQTGADR
jgi:UDP-2,4-diacetamido-2,4,6-trideoxy-beta-L-altropyranose hydrolase